MKNVEHEEGTTWTLCNVKNCNMKRLLYKKVQYGKYAAWKKCNMKREQNKVN